MPSILLIEDTEVVSRMYRYGLEREGFEVKVATSGGEALARVEEGTFDVIILDMMLSGMSGLDFLAEYDVKTKSPKTKLVVLSSVDNLEIIDRANAFHIDGYLVKSDYEPAALAEYVRKLLPPPIQATAAPKV